MNNAVCTLFEGHYHYGLAALSNSLYHFGFQGFIYAGFRGILPEWAKEAKENPSFQWSGCRTYKVAEGVHIHFLPLETDYHLTNYKPDFMLRLHEGPAKEAKGLFYFDPDIIINVHWSLFEKWIECGVALCEDVNSPMPENHPRRAVWRRYFREKGILLQFKEPYYVNGGFFGIGKEYVLFLSLWKSIQEKMATEIGGLSHSSLNGNSLPQEARGEFSPFPKTDQDALNATVEAWSGEISIVGKEGMGFKSGSALMYHALDQPKPWKKNPLLRIIKGIVPSPAEKNYWENAKWPIHAHTSGLIHFRKVCLSIAVIIGRFYRRN
ncbi:hypothetical protein [Cyclobacterium salsum]|uniref:hypothetical protein n=1 Tax=Cyclobacterium salsum TaxID=2666329 RepID=UPI001391A208|nr:hypothetical protein [Cyclobacterium salsum]